MLLFCIINERLNGVSILTVSKVSLYRLRSSFLVLVRIFRQPVTTLLLMEKLLFFFHIYYGLFLIP